VVEPFWVSSLASWSGLASALAVAVYVTKVPVPFMNKSQTRNADQNEAEALPEQGLEPNAPLAGKSPAPAATPAGPQAAALGAFVRGVGRCCCSR